MGACFSSIIVDPSAYEPDFFLQEGEVVLNKLKCTKRSLSPFLALILTVFTLGLFLLFKSYFKKVRSVEIVVLTNRRVMEWEYVIPRGNRHPHFIKQQSYDLADLTYYQHEIVQDAAACCGICKTDPFSTLRIFFNKFPSGPLPSYNNSPSLRPAVSDATSVARSANGIIAAGMTHNYIHLVSESIKLVTTLVHIVMKLLHFGRNLLFPGHYIEIDTNDKGSVQAIEQLIIELNRVQNKTDILRGAPRDNAAVLVGEDVSLFENVNDPVRITPHYLHLGPGERVLDSINEVVQVGWKDWLLAVATFSIYYWIVIRDLKNYKGSLLITDRRFVTIFAHNQHGLNAENKYIQITNSWFFSQMNSSSIETARQSGLLACLTSCCCPNLTSCALSVDCGTGSLRIRPSKYTEVAKVSTFFGKFFTYPSRPLLQSVPVSYNENDGVVVPEIYRVAGERTVYNINAATLHDCAYECSNLTTCGLLPHVDYDIGVTTHRLYVKFVLSNSWFKGYYTYEFFTHLENVYGFQIGETIWRKGLLCAACRFENAHIAVCFKDDDDWTLYVLLGKTNMNSPVVQNAGRMLSYIQNVLQNQKEFYIRTLRNMAPGGFVAPVQYSPYDANASIAISGPSVVDAVGASSSDEVSISIK